MDRGEANDAFLQKPFTPDALIPVLNYALLGPFRSLVASDLPMPESATKAGA